MTEEVRPESWVALGVIVGAHGLRGDLRVKLHNPDSTILLERDTVDLRQKGRERTAVIEHARPSGRGAIVITLAGCASREAADALHGAELGVSASELPPPEDGEYYIRDLVGLEVWSGEPEERLGTVEAILPYPSMDCLRVPLAVGVVEIPFSDRFVTAVDMKTRRVVVQNIDELDRVDA